MFKLIKKKDKLPWPYNPYYMIIASELTLGKIWWQKRLLCDQTYKKNNTSSCVPCIRYRNTSGSLRELEIAWKHPRSGLVFRFKLSFSQTSTRVSIAVWKHGKCFLFLQYSKHPHKRNCGLRTCRLKFAGRDVTSVYYQASVYCSINLYQVWMCFFGKKHLSGGTSLFRLIPMSCGMWR